MMRLQNVQPSDCGEVPQRDGVVQYGVAGHPLARMIRQKAVGSPESVAPDSG